MSFGDRLQALRRSSGLTQEEFAQQLNVSRQAVSKWESSRGYPELDKIIYICNRYQVSMGELFRDEVPLGGEEKGETAGAAPLPPAPLKKSIGDFLANLSPVNQLFLWSALALAAAVVLILFWASIPKGGDDMIPKLIWAALLVIFTIGEGISVGLTSIWFAAGSLAALICALFEGPWPLQIGLFLVVSALCLSAFRPVAKKYLNGKVERTNADRVIGSQATVVEEIDNVKGTGTVKVGSMPWTARSEGAEIVPVGAQVRILRIEGVKVYVETIAEQEKEEIK